MKTAPTSANKHRHLRRKRRIHWNSADGPKGPRPQNKYSPNEKQKKES